MTGACCLEFVVRCLMFADCYFVVCCWFVVCCCLFLFVVLRGD